MLKMEPCKRCGDARFVTMPRDLWPPHVIQPQMPCPLCSAAHAAEQKQRGQEDRLRAAWASLLRAVPARSTPLLGCLEQNTRVRSNLADLRAHVAAVVRHQLVSDPQYHVRVCTDIDLVTSWLYSADEIGDGEACSYITSEEREDPVYKRLPDLVCPPDLLVLRLGIKLAPNRALPDLVQEALLAREHLDRPTWVVEKAGDPLTSAYPCYSKELMEFLADWPIVDLSDVGDEPDIPAPGIAKLPVPATPPPAKTPPKATRPLKSAEQLGREMDASAKKRHRR